MSIILSVLIFFPLLGVLTILIVGRNDGRENEIKQIALWTSIITMLIAVVVLLSYNKSVAGLQLVDRFDWIPFLNIQYFVGVDGISILMILLTGFISVIAIMASWTAIDKQIKMYYIFMLLLEIGMMGVFLAQDLFLFYIFWEFTLIPMYFLIGIWVGRERV
jgi:NADH-quinone oxidoreductase subunit M